MSGMGAVQIETWIDKSAWGKGPWRREPDRMEWRVEEDDLVRLMIRHPTHGSWCGYVGLPPDHPLAGKDYDDVPDVVYDAAHGGLTFAGYCMEDERPQRERVCHVPKSGEPDDVYWLGFDCAHSGDLLPGLKPYMQRLLAGQRYRDARYVIRVCEELAIAVAAVRA